MSTLALLLMIGLSSGVITTTVTQSEILSSFRLFVLNRSRLAYGLVSCSFCFSHWSAAGILVIYWNDLGIGTKYAPLLWLCTTAASHSVSVALVRFMPDED